MQATELCDRLINRIEDLAASNSRLARAKQQLTAEVRFLRSTLSTAQAANRRHERDMQSAEKKIEEWEAYADHLRGLLTKKHQQLTASQRPKRLELEMPF